MSDYHNNKPFKPTKAGIVKKIFQTGKNLFTGGAKKTTGTGAITTTNISKNLKEFAKHKEDVIKTTDKHTKGLTEEGKTNVRKFVAPALSKISKITQQLPEKKAKGGRVGRKGGGDLGMQSVIYGLDKNPNITKADPKAKFIAAAKNKKKKLKKFDSPMAKAVKKKNKKKII